jgi:DNA (cytosine-5)-methyltransferase 1
MGYSQSFIVPVSRTQMYRQFGNSVAVPVVREVAKSLINCLKRYKAITDDSVKKGSLISV